MQQVKASMAAEAEAKSLADRACTLLQHQAKDLADATVQKEAATVSASRAARRAARLQGLLQDVRLQVQDHRVAQAAREATLQTLADERNRLDAALSSIQVQLAQANASVGREADRCKISLSPQAARAAAKAAYMSAGGQSPVDGHSGDVGEDEQATDASGQTYFSDASCNEGWEGASHHSSVAGSDIFKSAVEVSKKLDEAVGEHKPAAASQKGIKLEDSFREVGMGTPEIREPGRLRRTWGRRRLTLDGSTDADSESQTSQSPTVQPGMTCEQDMTKQDDASSAAEGSTGSSGGGESSGDTSSNTGDAAEQSDATADAAVGCEQHPIGAAHSASVDENSPPSDQDAIGGESLPRQAGHPDHNDSSSSDGVSDSESADTVPPLRALYSGQRRSLSFSKVTYHVPAAPPEEGEEHIDAETVHGSSVAAAQDENITPAAFLPTMQELTCKSSSARQRSPLRAFLRRHAQWSSK